jgi:signal transduction histidine kinase
MRLERADSLEGRLVGASLLLAAVVAGVFLALVVAISSLRAATQHEAAAKDRTAATLALEKLVLDAETGARGLAITGNERFLEPWRVARGLLPARLAQFERLFATSPQRPQATQLARQIRGYVDDYSVPLVALARIQPAAARTPVATAEGRRRIDAIRAGFGALLSAENQAAAAHAASSTEKSRRAIALGLGGVATSAVLILLFGVYLSRSIAHPLRAAAQEAQRLARGDLTTPLQESGPGEVGELARSFNDMAERLHESRLELEEQNARLRESERLKAELISIVSHELRTPLASILGFTELLLRRDVPQVERRHYLQIVSDQSKRLAALLNDFLDAQRVEEGRLELASEPLDLGVLLRGQVQLFLGQSDRHRLHVEVADEPLRIRGDQGRLSQVLANLLSNAIKYSPDGGTVDVHAERENGLVRVRISDEGMGIPENEQPRIFTKFFRGDAAASGVGGTGLGLALSREIVEAHGGRIGFTSARGAGSTFWLELPADTSAASGGLTKGRR